MIDYYAKIREAAADAETRGWDRIPSPTPTWRRGVEHTTPAHVIDYGWWTGATYSSLQFVSFILRGRDRAPGVVYKTIRTYWTPESNRTISFKRSMEIFAAETDPVHEGHH